MRGPEKPASMLTADDVPGADATSTAIEEFALTANGYTRWGDVEQVGAVADRVRLLLGVRALHLASNDELRAMLFFEQRAARHCGYDLQDHHLVEIRAVLEELRRRLATEPLVGSASLPGVPAEWLGAMVDGIRDQAPAITTAAARMSPEYAVVIAATLGLRRFLGSKAVLRLESVGRTDLVVDFDDTRHFFEFKAAWARGLRENLDGIAKDRRKLAARGADVRGGVIAFLFDVVEGAGAGRGSKEPLERTAERFERAAPEGLGPAAMQTRSFPLEDGGVRVDARLLVWGPGTP